MMLRISALAASVTRTSGSLTFRLASVSDGS
ncbi:hypothetical protein GA0115255_117484 [Streptomyces sp. Ncost-T6T-2b]|nr:hypothetical protein GA0115255_117484 [Streptomyces sp. Ncost-T6T-2b]